MIPVFQTNIHNEYTKGNCMRASLASIFILNIDDIPKFEEMDKNAWKNSFKRWLNKMKLSLKEQCEPPNDSQFYMAIGDTERGVLHCVVAQLGKTIHDPHPSQSGLINIKKYWLFEHVN
jgi:hypothetical protein